MATFAFLFEKLKETAVPPMLEERILKRLLSENVKTLRRFLALSVASLVASGGVFLYSLFAFGRSLWQSDFWSLLSLAFSDMDTVLNYSNDYLLSLLETFPVIALIAVLLPIFTLLVSLGWYLKLREYRDRYQFA